jgi:hypothetical protein
MPSTTDVQNFLQVAVGSGRGFTTLGLAQVVRSETGHGILNLLVAVARAVSDGDVRDALDSTDADALVAEALALSPKAVTDVRGLLSRCGSDPGPLPVEALAGLGLFA